MSEFLLSDLMKRQKNPYDLLVEVEEANQERLEEENQAPEEIKVSHETRQINVSDSGEKFIIIKKRRRVIRLINEAKSEDGEAQTKLAPTKWGSTTRLSQ